MKKNLFLVLITLYSFFIYSCSEEFNVKSPLEDVYVLNCILRSDDSVQYAIITKNYDVDGLDPFTNTIDPTVHNAKVKIISGANVYMMRDTVLSEVTTRYNQPVYCYYIKNLPLTASSEVQIEAELTNGVVLRSTSKAPSILFGQFQKYIPQIDAQTISYRVLFDYSWTFANNIYALCIPQLEIFYQKREGNNLVDKVINVPIYYDNDSVSTPIYPKATFNNNGYMTLDGLNRAMQKISAGDVNKKNYIINKIIFSVKAFDAVLSKYYSAYLAFEEAFTIKLRPTDISNIHGGKGIFGVSVKTGTKLIVDAIYVNSFGYLYNPID